MRARIALVVVTCLSLVLAQRSKLSGMLQDLVDQDLGVMDITKRCEKDMLLIRNGLRDREIWALKMLDASSHIGSDFIWGNNILIGSPRSCNLISSPAGIKFATDHIPIGVINLTEITAPISVGYRSIHARHWSELQVDLSTLEKNVLNFGFCLPSSCNNLDSSNLVKSILRNQTFIDRSLIGMNTKVIHTKLLRLRTDFFGNVFVTIFVIVLYFVLFMIALEAGYTSTKKFIQWLFDLNSVIVIEKENARKRYYEKILACFSIIENTKIIFSQEINKDSIEVLHGLRVFGMILFIIGHIMLFAMSSVTNMQHILVYAENFWLQPLYTIHLTLDTFFVLSGMVLSYIFFQNLKKRPIKKHILFFAKMVANRYLRLTPPYLISMLITVVVTKLVKDLSPYYLLDDDERKCERTWWRNVFYLNNLFPLKESCMIWSWFLGADFQCFVISAAFLVIFDKNKKIGTALFALTFLAASGITGYFGYTLGFGFTQDSLHKTADYLYTPFWGRIGAYFTGVFAGWYLSTKNRTLNLNKKWIMCGWIVGSLIVAGLLFGHRKKEVSPLGALFYAAFSRTVWGMGIIWIIIACSTGHGGLVNRVLSSKVFLPLSRMTYSAYLVNPIWILFVTMLNEAPYHIDFPMLPVMSMGFATTVYALAFVFMLLFENPSIRLVKLFTS